MIKLVLCVIFRNVVVSRAYREAVHLGVPVEILTAGDRGEFHLVVDADMTVGASHVICDRIEDALKAEIPSVRVTIHVEPDDEAKLPKGTTAVPFA